MVHGKCPTIALFFAATANGSSQLPNSHSHETISPSLGLLIMNPRVQLSIYQTIDKHENSVLVYL